MRVGLTGGIGSGKSTVAGLLAARGAHIVDADVLAREVVAAGTPGLDEVVAVFGPGVLTADGELDRAALGSEVFADVDALARLNAIVHPRVAARACALMAAAAPGSVIVHDVPLLVENDLAGQYDVLVVVEASRDRRTQRLREDRGMSDTEIEARMATQASDDERRAVAGEIIVNDGSRAELEAAVAALWQRLRASAPT